MPPAFRPGPALGGDRWPVTTVGVSVVAHAALAAALLLGALLWPAQKPKMYFVNLVPAVAAVGQPDARPAPPSPEPARRQAAPPVEKPEPPVKAPAPREVATRPARPELPKRPPDLPPRPKAHELPALPRPSLRESARPPEPAPPPRVAAARPTPAPAEPRRESAPPPQPGLPTGSAQGVGPLMLNAGDFPFAWYIQLIQRKLHEQWRPPPETSAGERVVAVFEIARDGQVFRPGVEQRSRSLAYDRAAIEAIAQAAPFPPLPAEFKESLLRIHIGFTFQAGPPARSPS